MTLRHLLSTLPVVLLLALAGCGGGDDDGGGGSSGGGGDDDAAALYDKAVKELDEIKSGHIDAHVDTTLNFDTSQAVKVREKARFAGEGGTALPRFTILIDVEQTDGAPQRVRLINTGETTYNQPNGAKEFTEQGASAVDALTETYKREQEALPPGRIPLLALTPSDWAKDPKIEGKETADGVPVQRVVAKLDVPAFLKDLETAKDQDIGMGVSLGQNARKLLEPGADVKTAKLVALIGEEDGRLRKLSADLVGDVGGEVVVDFDTVMDGLDEAQEIEPPPSK